MSKTELSHYQEIRQVLLDLVESLNNGNGLKTEPLAKMHFDAAVLKIETLENQNQVRHMVNRFLGWKLPDDFQPDAGITFDRSKSLHGMPTGTNLLTASQAEDMISYMMTVSNTPNGKSK